MRLIGQDGNTTNNTGDLKDLAGCSTVLGILCGLLSLSFSICKAGGMAFLPWSCHEVEGRAEIPHYLGECCVNWRGLSENPGQSEGLHHDYGLNSRARSVLDSPFLWPTIFLSWLRSEFPFLPQAQLQVAKPLAIVLPSSRHLAAYGRILREEIFTWVLVTSIKGNQSVAWGPSGKIQGISLRI